MAAQPGSDMPSASARLFIEDAVPMVLQWPTRGRDDAHLHELFVVDLARRASSWRACQMIVPDPASPPCHQPSSIGPPDRTIAGMFTVAAAMRQAGVVLSQPVVSTTPSNG